MANEATLYIETGLPIAMTCADGTGIEKGAVLKLTDPFTAIITSAIDDPVAGIAAGEKIASDGQTKIPVYREGIFKMTASGSITAGDAVRTSEVANKVCTAAINSENILGTALETASDGETLLVELKPMGINLA